MRLVYVRALPRFWPETWLTGHVGMPQHHAACFGVMQPCPGLEIIHGPSPVNGTRTEGPSLRFVALFLQEPFLLFAFPAMGQVHIRFPFQGATSGAHQSWGFGAFSLCGSGERSPSAAVSIPARCLQGPLWVVPHISGKRCHFLCFRCQKWPDTWLSPGAVNSWVSGAAEP